MAQKADVFYSGRKIRKATSGTEKRQNNIVPHKTDYSFEENTSDYENNERQNDYNVDSMSTTFSRNNQDSRTNRNYEENENSIMRNHDSGRNSETVRATDMDSRISEMTSSGNLVERLKMHLTNSSSKHLIGVFGINSDVVVNRSLESVRRNQSFYILPKATLMDDVVTMLGASLIGFLGNERSYASYYSTGAREHQIRQIYMTLEEATTKMSNDYYDYYGAFERLNSLNKSMQRYDKIKQALRLTNDLFRNDIKMIWNLEADAGALDYRVLKELDAVSCDELIIIVNTLIPFEMGADIITSQLTYSNPREESYQILSKFFNYGDLIQTN